MKIFGQVSAEFMCNDPLAGQPRHDATPTAVSPARSRRVAGWFTVERIETVVMTAEQYEQAVNALATLIVEWTTTPGLHRDASADHPSSE